MKNLELNQMENTIGGELSHECMGSIGLSAIVGGMFGGPLGYFAGAAWAYYINPDC